MSNCWGFLPTSRSCAQKKQVQCGESKPPVTFPFHTVQTHVRPTLEVGCFSGSPVREPKQVSKFETLEPGQTLRTVSTICQHPSSFQLPTGVTASSFPVAAATVTIDVVALAYQYGQGSDSTPFLRLAIAQEVTCMREMCNPSVSIELRVDRRLDLVVK